MTRSRIMPGMAGLLAGLIGLSGATRAEEPVARLRVAYFPEAAYADEPATFVVECAEEQPLVVKLGSEKLAEQTSRTNRMEITVSLDRSGVLVFQQAGRQALFHVVRPGDKPHLVEKDGFLYTERGPAILLAAHRFPPKHDRRWETLSFIRRLFRDDRPSLGKATLIYASGLAFPEPGKKIPPGKDWSFKALPDASRDIHALLTATNLVNGSDLVLLAFSDKDLEQGADAYTLRVKLEWFLQLAGPDSALRQMVVLPTLTASQKERFGEYLGGLTPGLAGNGGHYLRTDSRPEDARIEPGEWIEPVLKELGRMFIFKSTIDNPSTKDSPGGE